MWVPAFINQFQLRKNEMKFRNDNMLVRVAQGDAYCHGCEYIKFPRDQAIYDEALRFERFIAHPTHGLPAGAYTDDTQMSLANAELLLHGTTHSKRDFAVAFVKAFKRDERNGYAPGFQKLLESVHDGDELLKVIRPDSNKNGAMMRAVPFGAIKDINTLKRLTEIQARVTHDTDSGVTSAVATALMSHFTLYENLPLKELDDFMVTFMGPQYAKYLEPYDEQPVVGPEVGLKTMHCVLHLVRTATGLMDILEHVIRIGGDTDSVASVAWGIASARFQDEELPSFLEYGLENDTFGRDYLARLGKTLMDVYSASEKL